jgi:hypothetical protein
MADLESEIEKLSSVPELKQLAEALVGARKVYNTARAFQAQLCRDETPDTAAPSLDQLASLNLVEELVLQALPKGYLSEFDKEMAVAMCNAYRSVLEEDSGSALMDRMHSSAKVQALPAFGDVISEAEAAVGAPSTAKKPASARRLCPKVRFLFFSQIKHTSKQCFHFLISPSFFPPSW